MLQGNVGARSGIVVLTNDSTRYMSHWRTQCSETHYDVVFLTVSPVIFPIACHI
jgi:hypothetical protein